MDILTKNIINLFYEVKCKIMCANKPSNVNKTYPNIAIVPQFFNNIIIFFLGQVPYRTRLCGMYQRFDQISKER